MTEPSAEGRVTTLFAERFGGRPARVAIAPGRVNLIGEHVDYAEGLVLPLAIDRTIAVAARVREAGFPTIVHSESHGTVTLESEGPRSDRRSGDASWVNYVAGPLALLAERGVAVPPLEMKVASDLPAGGGLASSAALSMAALLVGSACAGIALEPAIAIGICQHAEHRFAGTPCGPMDMTAVLLAKAGAALLLDCRSGSMRSVPIPEGAGLLLVDSGVRHRLSDGGYAARRADVEEAARRLGIASLRDAEAADLSRLDGVLARRARHVVGEIGRVGEAVAALEGGDLPALGRLLTASHRSLRDDFEVSVRELDEIVERASTLPGVHGARLIGGGFGGFALLLADAPRLAAIREAFGATSFPVRPMGGAIVH